AEKSFHATYSKDAVAKIGLPSSSGEKESNQKNALNMSLFLNCSSNKSIPDILEKEEQVAYYVAEKIKTMQENGIPLNSIAILERSRRAYRNYIIKYLRSFSIPYILDSYEGLFSDGPANDIYNF
ncbi:MAG: hypothetical protein IKI31_06230, partial [Treponema sp.]|nr:hypothetical protein [Treponema sp.]